MSNVINFFWMRPRFTTMSRLCIRSYQLHGYECHVFAYEDIAEVPDGVVIRDGREVSPPLSECGSWCPNISHFLDLFRYQLLLKFGGWSADLDTVCLKPLDFPEEHVLAGEYNPEPPYWRVNVNMGKAPQGSSIVQYTIEKCRAMNLYADHHWGRTGPEAITETVAELKIENLVKSPSFFNPVPHTWIPRFIDPRADVWKEWKLDDAYCLHWWAAGWEQRGMNPDAQYPADSLYERLKAKYL